MLPNPLHPAIVHFPIVLAFLLPLSAFGAFWAIRRGAAPKRAWAAPLAISAALALSSWVAVETGEGEEEKVEQIVPHRALDTHEDAAELFLTLSGVLVLITGVGLAPGAVGRAGRAVATIGAVGLVAIAARVGHSGGALVYQYGAASAYTTGTALTAARDDMTALEGIASENQRAREAGPVRQPASARGPASPTRPRSADTQAMIHPTAPPTNARQHATRRTP
jgi:uncharacterized membrane protein